tara:strand:+ start:176 stop:409 length:234 start_codon:yes stop_codon:yes gene_type:complete
MNTNDLIHKFFNPHKKVEVENEYKPKLRIQSTVYPSDENRQWYPIITAVNDSDRRRTFDRFDSDLLNRILDIKNNKL